MSMFSFAESCSLGFLIVYFTYIYYNVQNLCNDSSNQVNKMLTNKPVLYVL